MPIRDERIFAHIALFIVAFIYGINYFISKVIFQYISPFGVLAMRSLSGIIFFGVATLLFFRDTPEKKDIPRILFCAFTGISLNQLFFLWGLAKTTEINAAVLMITSPIFVFLFSYFTRTEIITLRKVMGVLIAFAGSVFLILNGRTVQFGGGNTIAGDLMIIINALSYAAYLIAVKPLVARYQPIYLFALLFGTGGVLNILIGIQDLYNASWEQFSMVVLAGAAYIMICTTILSYLLNLWAMKTVPPGHVGIYVYLQPVFVVLMTTFAPYSVAPLTWTKICYILIIFLGVGLVTIQKPKKVVI